MKKCGLLIRLREPRPTVASADGQTPAEIANQERHIQASDGLCAGEVLRNVGPVDVYGSFLEWLVSNDSTHVCFVL